MTCKMIDGFYPVDWNHTAQAADPNFTSDEKYGQLIAWARQARRQNPIAFDRLTEWILDDSQWTEAQIAENKQVLMHGILTRFKVQNARLKAYLKALEPSGVVNLAVFKALDRFDDVLSGLSHDEQLQNDVTHVFSDFSIMTMRSVREKIAGSVTGPAGTNSAKRFGYINYLKDCDAQVQWALFMPQFVKQQQRGFSVEGFEYKKMPALRFIGSEGCELNDIDERRKLFQLLDTLGAHRSGFDYDLLFMHHDGLGVDVGPWHGVWGRFMKADTPVPEGLLAFDFAPHDDGKAGVPYCAQFALAIFSGDHDAMHQREGYDSDAMYDVTRNIILGHGSHIPYPHKYWTAEVFFEGFDQSSTGYLFAASEQA